jgi:hypothetical protein
MRYAARTTSVPGVNLLGLVYLVAGAIVAATHDYFENLEGAKTVGSGVLAVLLWPLIFLGIDLHIR